MLARAVGEYGASPAELRELQPRLKRARAAIIDQADTGVQGWMSLPDDREMMKRVERLAASKKGFNYCLVIGIGGSDLGARALYKALSSSVKAGAMQLVFLGGNTDPYEIATTLKHLDLRKTLVTIISKSGETIEPMATFFVVREALQKAVGKDKAHHQIVAITDQGHGALWALSQREGYATLPVPSNVGGRFSVLSDVGLFPLACAGISVTKLLEGARAERDHFFSSSSMSSGALMYASLQFLAYTKRKQHIHVLMPYAEQLREFGFWYRQLWAESLGKALDREGKIVNIGPTPVAALGATDQHSQIQLYAEGPRDKTVTCIEVENFGVSMNVPRNIRSIPSLAFLSGRSFTDIIHAEREATITALRTQQRPNGTIFIPSISPVSIGSLIMFFELATAVCGELFEIDAYNQPGVEGGKQEMHRLLFV